MKLVLSIAPDLQWAWEGFPHKRRAPRRFFAVACVVFFLGVLIPLPLFSSIVLFKNRSLFFAGFLDGFLKRSDSWTAWGRYP